MRALLMATILAGSAAGCNKSSPPPAVVRSKVPADNPSILVNPPYPGADQTGAKPRFPKMYAVGNSGANNDRLGGDYRSSAKYTLQRGDGAEINPEDVAAELRRWIGSTPGVKVTRNTDDAPAAGTIRRVIDYETAGTIGYAVYEVEPSTPARKVQYTLDIRERRR